MDKLIIATGVLGLWGLWMYRTFTKDRYIPEKSRTLGSSSTVGD